MRGFTAFLSRVTAQKCVCFYICCAESATFIMEYRLSGVIGHRPMSTFAFAGAASVSVVPGAQLPFGTGEAGRQFTIPRGWCRAWRDISVLSEVLTLCEGFAPPQMRCKRFRE